MDSEEAAKKRQGDIKIKKIEANLESMRIDCEKEKHKADLDLEAAKVQMKTIHDEEMTKLKNAQEISLKELDLTEAGQRANVTSLQKN